MRKDHVNGTFLVELTFSNDIIDYYGDRRTLWLNYIFPLDSPLAIVIQLQCFNRTVTRLLGINLNRI